MKGLPEGTKERVQACKNTSKVHANALKNEQRRFPDGKFVAPKQHNIYISIARKMAVIKHDIIAPKRHIQSSCDFI